MSAGVETRIQNLETALKHLQNMEEEHFETLNNDFSNRTESQHGLLQYLFKQTQILKEVILLLSGELNMDQTLVEELWTRAKEKVASYSVQDVLLDEYRKELGKDNND